MIGESRSKEDYTFDDQWRLEREKLLSYVTAQLLVSQNPQACVSDIYYKTMEFLNCDIFLYYLVDESREALELNAYAGIPDGQVQPIKWLKFDTAFNRSAASECQPIIITKLLEALGVQAYATQILKIGKQIIGTISFGRSSMVISRDEFEVMETVATYTAVAIERDLNYKRIVAVKEHYRSLAKRLHEIDLVESEGKFSKAFYSSPTMMAITSMQDGRYIDVNKAWQDALGFSRMEVLGTTSVKLNLYVFPEQRDDVYRYLSGSDRYSNVEINLRTKSGDILTCISSAEAIMLGGERCMLSNRINVTERKLMEEQLRLNQQRLEALQKINQMTSATTDEIAQYAYQEALKLTKSELGCLEFINEEDSEQHVFSWSNKSTVQSALPETNKAFLSNESGLWAELIGERRPIIKNDYAVNSCGQGQLKGYSSISRLLAVPIFDGKRIVAVVSVVNKKDNYVNSDIQQLQLLIEGVWSIIRLRKEQEALRISEERFFKAFQSSPLMMAIICMRDERFIEVNHKYLEIMEYQREEVIGHTSFELDLFVDKERTRRLLDRLIIKGNIKVDEHLIRTKSGKIITVLGSMVAIHLNDMDCRLVAFQDISAKKETEAQIARLDRLNLIGEMAASIGHEIRNPMTAVRGFLQMFKLNDEHSKDSKYFDLMIEELDRANAIISEYLNMAKDKLVDLQPQYLDNMIKSLCPLIQADANYREINVCLVLGRPPMPLVDAKEIRQIILNMARNGLEAMSAGGTLTIGTMVVDSEIVLFIKDEGNGIDPSILSKLGTPFVTTKDKGTGLGLAVCYSIAARHNARIDYETGPGGTTFKVCFPMPTQQIVLF